jgi:predicted nucleotidyltransferase
MGNRIYSIDEITNIVAPIARSYGIGRLALFGSYARGDATTNSDIDLRIIDKGSLRGMFQLAGFNYDLEEKFDIHVDVLPTDAISDEILDEITKEEIIVYAS